MRVTNKHLEPRGCDRVGEDMDDDKLRHFYVLISLMLSSQTKDTMTDAAMDRLIEKGFTVQNGIDIDVDELGKIIYPVGFWRVREKKERETIKISLCSAKHNISNKHVRFYEINTMMTFRILSKVYAHYPVRQKFDY
jgi:endonuclease III